MSSRWHLSWSEGRTGFHKKEVHSDLLDYEEPFIGTSSRRVLVPLCGKSVDLVWLADKGHQVVGIELVPQAVEEFFSEQGLTPSVETTEHYARFSAGPISILCGDVLKIEAEDVGPVDRIWDRAALVALPPEIHSSYIHKLRQLCSPKSVVLQNVFEYDETVMSGPPFSIPDSEIRELYAGCDIKTLHDRDVIDEAPMFQEKGHTFWLNRTYLISL